MPLRAAFASASTRGFSAFARAKLNGLTPNGAAPSASFIKQNFPESPSGLYWISFADGSKHQILCDMTTAGGGWMNMSPIFGSYSTALTSTWGNGGGNLLANRTSVTSDTPLAGPSVANSQAQFFGCPGHNGASRIAINTSLISEKSLTQVRVRAQVTGVSNVNCGFFLGEGAGVLAGSLQMVSGNQANISTCSESPRYDQVWNSTPFEWYHTMTNNVVVTMYTACSGSNLTGNIQQIWVK